MKILIVRFSALGDLVLTTGPTRTLKKMRPDLEIHLLTSSLGAELLQNSLEISKIHVVEKGDSFGKIISAYKRLPPFDIIFDLQGNLKSFWLRLFQKAPIHRVKKQSRERRAFVKSRKFKQALNKHVVEKYFHCFREGFDLPQPHIESLRPVLFSNSLTYDSKEFDFTNSIVIHPYASQKNKVWPHTKDLIQAIHEMGHEVIVIGSDSGNENWGERVLDLTNKTSIHEMLAFVGEAKALISTDSGPMHIGVARNTPTLAIFGPTTKEFGFYPTFENTKVIENSNLDCRPCHVHGGNQCPKEHFKCMKEITVNQVIENLKSLI